MSILGDIKKTVVDRTILVVQLKQVTKELKEVLAWTAGIALRRTGAENVEDRVKGLIAKKRELTAAIHKIDKEAISKKIDSAKEGEKSGFVAKRDSLDMSFCESEIESLRELLLASRQTAKAYQSRIEIAESFIQDAQREFESGKITQEQFEGRVQNHKLTVAQLKKSIEECQEEQVAIKTQILENEESRDAAFKSYSSETPENEGLIDMEKSIKTSEVDFEIASIERTIKAIDEALERANQNITSTKEEIKTYSEKYSGEQLKYMEEMAKERISHFENEISALQKNKSAFEDIRMNLTSKKIGIENEVSREHFARDAEHISEISNRFRSGESISTPSEGGISTTPEAPKPTFADRIKKAGEFIGKAIESASEKLEEIGEAIDEGKKEREIEKRLKKDPVGYYRELISFNGENIKEVNISKLTHSEYKQLCIEAVKSNPTAYNYIQGPLKDDITICKIAKVAMARRKIGHSEEQLNEAYPTVVKEFPSEMKDFSATEFVESHNGDFSKAIEDLIEADKAKEAAEIENSRREFEERNAEAAQESKPEEKGGFAGIVAKLIGKIGVAKEAKRELDDSIEKVEEIVEEVPEDESELEAPAEEGELVVDEGGTDTTSPKDKEQDKKPTFKERVSGLFAPLVTLAKGVKEKLESAIETGEMEVEATKKAEKDEIENSALVEENPDKKNDGKDNEVNQAEIDEEEAARIAALAEARAAEAAEVEAKLAEENKRKAEEAAVVKNDSEIENNATVTDGSKIAGSEVLEDAEKAAEPPKKKKGFFARLFRRGKEKAVEEKKEDNKDVEVIENGRDDSAAVVTTVTPEEIDKEKKSETTVIAGDKKLEDETIEAEITVDKPVAEEDKSVKKEDNLEVDVIENSGDSLEVKTDVVQNDNASQNIQPSNVGGESDVIVKEDKDADPIEFTSKKPYPQGQSRLKLSAEQLRAIEAEAEAEVRAQVTEQQFKRYKRTKSGKVANMIRDAIAKKKGQALGKMAEERNKPKVEEVVIEAAPEVVEVEEIVESTPEVVEAEEVVEVAPEEPKVSKVAEYISAYAQEYSRFYSVNTGSRGTSMVDKQRRLNSSMKNFIENQVEQVSVNNNGELNVDMMKKVSHPISEADMADLVADEKAILRLFAIASNDGYRGEDGKWNKLTEKRRIALAGVLVSVAERKMEIENKRVQEAQARKAQGLQTDGVEREND